jgi:hypothetical protein
MDESERQGTMPPPEQKPSFLSSFARSLRAVGWSFFGVRKGRDRERDFAQLNPLHVVIAGLLCMAAFIVVLILVVKAVVH